MNQKIFHHLKTARERLNFLEPLVLIGFMLLWFFLWGFLEVSDDMVEGDTHGIDTRLLMLLRDGTDPANALGPLWVQEMMRDISGLGGILILSLVTLSASLYLLMMKKKGQAAYLLLTVTLGTLISNALKHGYARPRPDLVPHGAYTFTSSFPSGHSMMAALVYLSIGMMLARAHATYNMKIYFIATSLIITIAIGISRVYLGVHWPSDVLAGWLIGGSCAITFWLIEWAWQEKIISKLRASLRN